jgi:hypothetical protein
VSTLQHTANLRERATRRLVLVLAIVAIAVAGLVAGIVAITSGGSSSSIDTSGFVRAQPVYASGALEHGLPQVKTAHAGAVARSQRDDGPTLQTLGHRP